MKRQIKCDYCGKEFTRLECQMSKHNFCGKECAGHFSDKRTNPDGYKYRDFTKQAANFSALAKRDNPTRMTPEVRGKLREARLGRGEGRTYTKTFGRHTHRCVAEQILGRPLNPGEVVPHIDGNRRNNAPENIRVFASQADHARYHMAERKQVAQG